MCSSVAVNRRTTECKMMRFLAWAGFAAKKNKIGTVNSRFNLNRKQIMVIEQIRNHPHTPPLIHI